MSVCEDRRIAHAVRIIIADLSKRVSRNDAARLASLQPAYFSKRFREVTDTSFTTWSRSLRIEKAKELLRVLDMTVTQVATLVGYGDVTTFERCFRKHVGVAPREFRGWLKTAPENIPIAESGIRNAETGKRRNG